MVPLRGAEPGSYFAIQAFIQRTPEHDELLSRLRATVRFATRLATTAGYGPRYLHSTGQLHKGGPAKAVFLQLTCDDPEELPIPGNEVLRQAQHERELPAENEVLRQAQHERIQPAENEVLRQAQHERIQPAENEVLRQAQHERIQSTENEVLRQAQHERIQSAENGVLRQAQHERIQPDSAYGFSSLKRAQALGDLRALQSRGRRVMRVHLGADPAAGLARLLETMQQSTAPASAAASVRGA